LKLYHQIQELLTDWNIGKTLHDPNLFIYKIEDYFGNEPLSIEPYRQDFFELTFGTGHDVDCRVGTSTFKPIYDSISFTSPYQISSWRVNTFNPDSLGYMIFFKPQLLGSTLDKIDFYKQYSYFNLHTSPVLFLDQTQRDIVVQLMRTLLQEYNDTQQEGYQMILASYLTILLEKVKGFFEKSTTLRAFTSRAEEIAFQFENILKEQAHYSLKIADYASQLHISPSYLTESVKKVTGKTPITVAQEYLVLKAKGILSQTNKPIAVIANELGFHEASNFNKYFKKNTGFTPGTYRKTP